MINALMAALVAELAAEEVLDPLHQRFILAGVWADLARLAGEPLPADVAAVVGDTLAVVCDPLPPARQAHLTATLAADGGSLADPDRARAYFPSIAATLPAD